VDVPLADADPVHGGEVTHRIAALGVEDELGLRGGPAREVEEDRVVDVGLAVGDEVGGLVVRLLEGVPARNLLADHDAAPVPREPAHLLRASGVGDHVSHLPARHAVLDVLRRQERRGRDDHRPELHGGEHHLPDLDRVGQHHENAVPSIDAVAP
jgi:hypothetical protein